MRDTDKGVYEVVKRKERDQRLASEVERLCGRERSESRTKRNGDADGHLQIKGIDLSKWRGVGREGEAVCAQEIMGSGRSCQN